MIKKLVVSAVLVIAALFVAASPVGAEEQCTTSYGQPVVCGVTTITTPHQPIKAGLGDVNFGVLAVAAFITSAAAFVYSKKFVR